jgi:hypothetical protein
MRYASGQVTEYGSRPTTEQDYRTKMSDL